LRQPHQKEIIPMIPTDQALALDFNAMRLAAARESIDRLELLRPGAEDIIFHLLDGRLIEHPGKLCTAYRQDGEQLSKEEKRALGLRSNAALSRKAFGELTQKGRENPLRAHETVLLRATFTLSRYQAIVRARGFDLPEFCDDYRYSMLRADCDACAALDGMIVKGDAAAIFPPPGCTCDTANYGLEVSIDWLANLE
jgi:hypothetical protein